jgi:SAM-dependent methyltransferase
MKLSQKLGKLRYPVTYRRGWRRAQRSIFRLPFGQLLKNIDQQRLQEISQRYASSPAQYAKYADIDHWLRVNRERVQDLKLHRSLSKRIVDLGCGGGFFLFILKGLGHSVLGLDVDESPLFAELLDLFSVPRIVWKIEAFEPLPDLGGKFDWITAFSTSFNRHQVTKRPWETAEWDFLLRDLQRRLAPGGKIFLGLNPAFDGEYYTQELQDFFASRGADIEKERVFFRNGLRL